MKQTSAKALAVLFGCGLSAVIASGCAWSIGEGKEHSIIQKPTRGQELVDLKKARDQGAISEEEYNNQKNQILNR